MSIAVHWRVSQSATCCHAAEVICRQRRVIDARLDGALRGPAEQLRQEVLGAGVPEEVFWEHLAPLAAGIDENRQLADAVLRKALGAGRYGEAVVAALARCLAQLETAGRRAVPELAAELSESSGHLRQQWDVYGPGLLARVALLTDERVIVDEATVDLLYPVLGGGGVAHLPYNTVRVEVLACDPAPDLPEVVRLAWLVAQLNADLPVLSEDLARNDQKRLARLALLPAVLHASEELELTPPGA